MNKIQRIVFTFACLLTTLGGYADSFKINELNVTNGTLTAKMGETDITAGTTEIPFNTLVTLTVTPTSGYYLESLTYEEVTDLGQAQAPQRRDPEFQTIHTITLQHPETYFGGDYTFYMPNNNVIVTARCSPLTNFSESLPSVSLGNSPITYDGQAHSLVVKAGETTLTEGTDYRITGMTFNSESTGSDYTIKNAGNYVVSLEGIGIYKGSKTSGTLTIAQKPLTITAKNQSYQYAIGSTISTATGWVTIDATYGLASNDALTGITLIQSTTNVTGDTPGTITPSAAVTTNGIENYDVTYVNGTLTITPKPYNSTNFPITQTFTEVNYSLNTPQKPGITVSDGTTALTENVDYELGYTSHFFPSDNPISDFSRPDIYYVTITFKGNYSGSVSLEYQIRKELELSSVNKWNTYYDPSYDMQVVPDDSATPQDYKAYTVSGIGTTAVILTEQNYIKKATPMLLYKRGTIYQFYPPLVKEVGGTNWGMPDAYLKGIAVATDIGSIITSNPGNDIWILVNDQFVRSKTGTLSANRCYLALENGKFTNPAFALEVDPTGIDVPRQILNDLEHAVWYTIGGQRLQGVPAQKGIYIMNGRKLIIK